MVLKLCRNKIVDTVAKGEPKGLAQDCGNSSALVRE